MILAFDCSIRLIVANFLLEGEKQVWSSMAICLHLNHLLKCELFKPKLVTYCFYFADFKVNFEMVKIFQYLSQM